MFRNKKFVSVLAFLLVLVLAVPSVIMVAPTTSVSADTGGGSGEHGSGSSTDEWEYSNSRDGYLIFLYKKPSNVYTGAATEDLFATRLTDVEFNLSSFGGDVFAYRRGSIPDDRRKTNKQVFGGISHLQYRISYTNSNGSYYMMDSIPSGTGNISYDEEQNSFKKYYDYSGNYTGTDYKTNKKFFWYASESFMRYDTEWYETVYKRLQNANNCEAILVSNIPSDAKIVTGNSYHVSGGFVDKTYFDKVNVATSEDKNGLKLISYATFEDKAKKAMDKYASDFTAKYGSSAESDVSSAGLSFKSGFSSSTTTSNNAEFLNMLGQMLVDDTENNNSHLGRQAVLKLFEDEFDRNTGITDEDDFWIVAVAVTIPKKVANWSSSPSCYTGTSTEIAIDSYCPIPGMIASTKNIWNVSSAGAFDNGRVTNVTDTSLGGGAKAYQLSSDNDKTFVGNFFSFIIAANNALYQERISWGQGGVQSKIASFEPFPHYTIDDNSIKKAWSKLAAPYNDTWVPTSEDSRAKYWKKHYTAKFWFNTGNKVLQKGSTWLTAAPCCGMGYAVFGPQGVSEGDGAEAYYKNFIAHYDFEEDADGNLRWVRNFTVATRNATLYDDGSDAYASNTEGGARSDKGNNKMKNAYSISNNGSLWGASYWKSVVGEKDVTLVGTTGTLTDTVSASAVNGSWYGIPVLDKDTQYEVWAGIINNSYPEASYQLVDKPNDTDGNGVDNIHQSSEDYTLGILLKGNVDFTSLQDNQCVGLDEGHITDLLVDATAHRVDVEAIKTSNADYGHVDDSIYSGSLESGYDGWGTDPIYGYQHRTWDGSRWAFDPSVKSTYNFSSLDKKKRWGTLPDGASGINWDKQTFKSGTSKGKFLATGGHAGIVASVPMPKIKTTVHRVNLSIDDATGQNIITNTEVITAGSVEYLADKAHSYPTEFRPYENGTQLTPDVIIYVPSGHQLTDAQIEAALNNQEFYASYDKVKNYAGNTTGSTATRKTWKVGASALVSDVSSSTLKWVQKEGYEIYEVYHKKVKSINSEFVLKENYLADGTSNQVKTSGLASLSGIDVQLKSGTEGKSINNYFHTRTMSSNRTYNTFPGWVYGASEHSPVTLTMYDVLNRTDFSAQEMENGSKANFIVPVVSSLSNPSYIYSSGTYAFYLGDVTHYGLSLGTKPAGGTLPSGASTSTYTYKDKFFLKAWGTGTMYDSNYHSYNEMNWNVKYTVKSYIPGLKSMGKASTFNDNGTYVVNGKKEWKFYPEVAMDLTYGGKDMNYYDRTPDLSDADVTSYLWSYRKKLLTDYTSHYYPTEDRYSYIYSHGGSGASDSWWSQQWCSTPTDTAKVYTIGLRDRHVLSSYFIKGLYNVTNQALPDRAGVLMSDTMVVKSGSLPQIYAGSDITLSVKGDAASSAVKVDADFYCLSPLDSGDSVVHGTNKYLIDSYGKEFEMTPQEVAHSAELFEEDKATWNDDISGNETNKSANYEDGLMVSWYKSHPLAYWDVSDIISNASALREWNGGGSPIDILEDDIEEVVGVEARIDKAEVVLHLDYSGSTADKDIRFPVDINMPTEDEPPVTITWDSTVWQLSDGRLGDTEGLPSDISRWNIGQALKNACERNTSTNGWYVEKVFTFGIRKCHVKAESGNKVGDLMIEDKIPYSYMPAKGETAKGTWKFNAYDSDGNLLITFGIKNADFQLIYGTNEDL